MFVVGKGEIIRIYSKFQSHQELETTARSVKKPSRKYQNMHQKTILTEYYRPAILVKRPLFKCFLVINAIFWFVNGCLVPLTDGDQIFKMERPYKSRQQLEQSHRHRGSRGGACCSRPPYFLRSKKKKGWQR